MHDVENMSEVDFLELLKKYRETYSISCDVSTSLDLLIKNIEFDLQD